MVKFVENARDFLYRGEKLPKSFLYRRICGIFMDIKDYFLAGMASRFVSFSFSGYGLIYGIIKLRANEQRGNTTATPAMNPGRRTCRADDHRCPHRRLSPKVHHTCQLAAVGKV